MGVRLVATKVLNYAGQRYTPGEPFISRTKEHARLLKALGRAVDEPPAVPHKPEPVAVTHTPEIVAADVPEYVVPDAE